MPRAALPCLPCRPPARAGGSRGTRSSCGALGACSLRSAGRGRRGGGGGGRGPGPGRVSESAARRRCGGAGRGRVPSACCQRRELRAVRSGARRGGAAARAAGRERQAGRGAQADRDSPDRACAICRQVLSTTLPISRRMYLVAHRVKLDHSLLGIGVDRLVSLLAGVSCSPGRHRGDDVVTNRHAVLATALALCLPYVRAPIGSTPDSNCTGGRLAAVLGLRTGCYTRYQRGLVCGQGGGGG